MRFPGPARIAPLPSLLVVPCPPTPCHNEVTETAPQDIGPTGWESDLTCKVYTMPVAHVV